MVLHVHLGGAVPGEGHAETAQRAARRRRCQLLSVDVVVLAAAAAEVEDARPQARPRCLLSGPLLRGTRPECEGYGFCGCFKGSEQADTTGLHPRHFSRCVRTLGYRNTEGSGLQIEVLQTSIQSARKERELAGSLEERTTEA